MDQFRLLLLVLVTGSLIMVPGILQFYGDLPNGISRDNPPLISYYKYVGKAGGAGGASITISGTAPADADPGSMWWNSDTGDLLLRYEDTDSAQWVSAIGGAGGFFELNSATNTISTPYNLTAPSKNFRIPLHCHHYRMIIFNAHLC